MSNQNNIYYFTSIISVFTLIMLFSCKSTTLTETQKEEAITDSIKFPSRIIDRGRMVSTDSGYNKMVLKAPLIQFYEFEKEPYTLFPKGFTMYFYNDYKTDTAGYLQAKWAKLWDKKELYHAKGNVVLITQKRDTLIAEEIYYDKKEHLIYNDIKTLMIKNDGTEILSKGGVISSDDLLEFTLRKNKGKKRNHPKRK